MRYTCPVSLPLGRGVVQPGSTLRSGVPRSTFHYIDPLRSSSLVFIPGKPSTRAGLGLSQAQNFAMDFTGAQWPLADACTHGTTSLTLRRDAL